MSRSRRTLRLFAPQIMLTVLVLPFTLSLMAMVKVSLSGEGWQNYAAVLRLPEFPRAFLNSVLLALAVVVVTYVTTMLAAYGFARLKLPMGEFFFYAILATMTLPGAALMVPLFIVVQNAGLLDSLWAVIIPLVALVLPLNVLLARNFVAGLPREVFEAATIDGCGTLRIFRYIVLPLSRPISAVVVVWSFLSAWNEYLLPLLFLQSGDKQTITLMPQYFTSRFGSDQTKIIACTVLIAAPTILVERGMIAGAGR